MLIRQYWYVPAFFAVEAVWIALMSVRMRVVRDQEAKGFVRPAHPSMEPVRGWRLVEVLWVLYHFPVVVPTAAIRKDDSVPWPMMYLFTPTLYSAIAVWAAAQR